MQKSTRRNHTGNFTTTIVLDSGRIYGHGRTREAAEASAQNVLKSHLEIRDQQRVAAATAAKVGLTRAVVQATCDHQVLVSTGRCVLCHIQWWPVAS